MRDYEALRQLWIKAYRPTNEQQNGALGFVEYLKFQSAIPKVGSDQFTEGDARCTCPTDPNSLDYPCDYCIAREGNVRVK